MPNRVNAPNLRFAATCLDCKHSHVTVEVNGSPLEYRCSLHDFEAAFESGLVCDHLVNEHF